MDHCIEYFCYVIRKRKAEDSNEEESKRVKLDSGEEDSNEASIITNINPNRSSSSQTKRSRSIHRI